jgi:5'-3' exonuclease
MERCQDAKRAGLKGSLWAIRTSSGLDGINSVIVHLIDGTYELFRHFYGLKRAKTRDFARFGAVRGVLHTVLQMLADGATHIGVATDHVIESFRNELWHGYKTGEGVEPALLAQFEPLEDALRAMGVAVWAMVDLEADDALASAAEIASCDPRVQKICIWTPDKDLSQCVRGDRIVQVDRRSKAVRNAGGVRSKFGVDPEFIADFLALVGDTADGYPGIQRIGAKGAQSLISRYGKIENFPAEILGEYRARALLFKRLATLRTDAMLFENVDELQWRGPTAECASVFERLGIPDVFTRAARTAEAQASNCAAPLE